MEIIRNKRLTHMVTKVLYMTNIDDSHFSGQPDRSMFFSSLKKVMHFVRFVVFLFVACLVLSMGFEICHCDVGFIRSVFCCIKCQ